MNRRSMLSVLAATPLAALLAGCVGTAYAPVSYAPAPEPRRYALASDVLFDFNSATLRPGAAAALSGTLGEIRQVYPYPAIQVQGFTDSIGSAAFNLGLSQRRAESVRQWLMANGIPPNAITTQGFGESDPVAPNTVDGRDNPAGRQQNRRVVLLATPYQS